MSRYRTANGLMLAFLLLSLFLLSGATSLVYETVWERQLQLSLGGSQLAVTVVLSGFMAGLAGGAFLGSRLIGWVTRPLVVYGVMELFIGLYAMLFPTLLDLIEPFYLSFWTIFEPHPLLFGCFQFAMVGCLLLPPTLLMGATLPLLAQFAAQKSTVPGRWVGWLYGANTLGAVCGVGTAGFLLLPTLGLWKTTLVTASCNGILCLLAVTLGWKTHVKPTSTSINNETGVGKNLLWTAALAGVASLILEVTWFRYLTMIFGGSAYAFSTMLLSFLIGIGMGGWLGGFAVDRIARKHGENGVLRWAGGIQILVAFLSYIGLMACMALPGAFVYFTGMFGGTESPEGLWRGSVFLAMCLMAPPAIAMGAAFPFWVRGRLGPHAEVGQEVGRVYGWNTVGAILGAALAGLALIPLIGVRWTAVIAIAVQLISAIVAWAPLRMPQFKWGVFGLFASLIGLSFVDIDADGAKDWPPFNPLLMTSGVLADLKHVSHPDDGLMDAIRRVDDELVASQTLLFYKEGPSTAVTVGRGPSGNIWLANNGKVEASTQSDMQTQVLVGHLPFLFNPSPQSVLLIGLASGVSAGSIASHCQPDEDGKCRVGSERFDVVELEPATVAASSFFASHNGSPLEDSRVRLHIEDGRNHLLRTPNETFDVIFSQPSNPWLTGVANLFTSEFFQLGATKLKSDGLWVQWVQLYGMAADDFKSLLATFQLHFPHVWVFASPIPEDLILVGSAKPMPFSIQKATAAWSESTVVADLRRVGMPRLSDVMLLCKSNEKGMMSVVEDAIINTDDNMRIEYAAPLNLHRETLSENTAVITSMSRSCHTEVFYPGPEDRLHLIFAQIRQHVPMDKIRQNWREARRLSLDLAFLDMAKGKSVQKRDPRIEAVDDLLIGLERNRLSWGASDTDKPRVDLRRVLTELHPADLQLDLVFALHAVICRQLDDEDESDDELRLQSQALKDAIQWILENAPDISSSEREWLSKQLKSLQSNPALEFQTLCDMSH